MKIKHNFFLLSALVISIPLLFYICWQYSQNKLLNDTMPYHLKSLTMQQALNDYEIFWDNIYRYHSAIATISDEELAYFQDIYRKKIENLDPKDELFAKDYFVLIVELMQKGLGNVGHLSVVTSDYIQETIKYSNLFPNEFPNYSKMQADEQVMQTANWIEEIFNIDTGKFILQNKDAAITVIPENITFDILDGNIGYMKIPSFETAFIERDAQLIDEWMNSHTDMDYIIIDIRGNGGGNDKYWIENLLPWFLNNSISKKTYTFIKGWPENPDCTNLENKYQNFEGIKKDWEEVFDLPNTVVQDIQNYSLYTHNITYVSENGFNGHLFLLVDEKVYSAASGFADLCKYAGIAELIGKPTAGDAGSGLEPVIFVLPNSKLAYWHRIDYCLNPDGSSQIGTVLEPDIYTKDDALQECLKLINNREEVK